MPTLTQQHCLNHLEREAAARCPECRQFFCRECVVEHDDRVLCGPCLRKISKGIAGPWRPARALTGAVFTLGGFLTAYLFFYWLGQCLLAIPDSFQDSALWSQF